jgi:hypothetical protein
MFTDTAALPCAPIMSYRLPSTPLPQQMHADFTLPEFTKINTYVCSKGMQDVTKAKSVYDLTKE